MTEDGYSMVSMTTMIPEAADDDMISAGSTGLTEPLESSAVFTTTGAYVTTESQSDSQIFTSEVISYIYMTIGLLGMVANAFVIIVMLFSPSLRKALINIYILNQSFCDFMVSLMLCASYDLDSDVPYSGVAGDVYCLLWQTRVLLWGCLNVSTYNLVLLSLERYSEVLHPFWHKIHVTKKAILTSIAILWACGFIFEMVCKLPPTYVQDGFCYFMQRWPSDTARRVYGFTVVIVKFIVPLVALIVTYGRIAWALHKKIEQSMTGKDAKLQRGKRNTIKTMAIVAAVFVICWVSNQVNFFLFNAGFDINLYTDYSHFTIMAIYLNCCINPFIYALKYEQFQAASRKLLCAMIGRKPTNQVGDASSTVASSNVNS